MNPLGEALGKDRPAVNDAVAISQRRDCPPCADTGRDFDPPLLLGKLAFSLIQSASFVSPQRLPMPGTAERSTARHCAGYCRKLNAVNGGAPDFRRRRYDSTMMPIAPGRPFGMGEGLHG